MVLAVLTGWVDRQERQALAYLMEENRLRRRQLGRQRLQFTDADRCRLAALGRAERFVRSIKSECLNRMVVIRKYSIRLEFSAISVCNDDPTEAGVPSCGTLSHAETLVPVNRVADCRAVTR
jgi:hypothetical protein